MGDIRSILPDEQWADIPYDVWFAEDDAALPEPLPTVKDIINAENVLLDQHDRATKRIGNSYVVKYGEEVTTLEAQNMQFVRQHTRVRVPRVYGVYQQHMSSIDGDDITICYIIMEYIAGKSLATKWRRMDENEKLSVSLSLKECLADLRKLRNPTGEFEKLDKSGLLKTYFPDSEKQEMSISKDENAFISDLVSVFRLARGELAERVGYYAENLPKYLSSDEEPVFTHGDLERRNVMVTPSGEVVLIDWAESGWYPVYWESSTALFTCDLEDDWRHYVGIISGDYSEQIKWLSNMWREMLD